MKVFVFQSKRPHVHGFSLDSEGATLPKSLGPWRFVASLDLSAGASTRAGVNPDAVLAEIQKAGYFLSVSDIGL